MSQTIRDYLKRRVRWCMAIGFAGWLVFASALFAGDPAINPIVSAVGALMFGGAIVFAQFWIKCPRCSVRLGQIALTMAIPGLRPTPNFCPYCGVSFEEAWPPLAPADQKLREANSLMNPIK